VEEITKKELWDLISEIFSWGSENCARRTRIVDVVYNASNIELVRTKTLVAGAIVSIDSTPFRSYYEEWYNLPVGKEKTTSKVKDETKLHKAKLEKLANRRKDHELDSQISSQLASGKILAIIRSRPGQVGRADGYVLEGPELAFYLKKIAERKKKK